MLTENFIAGTFAANKQSAHIASALKDVGIFTYELQPQATFRSGFKKSSVKPRCLAISDSHVFAAQADKAIINVYNREKGNQEATIPFPDRIASIIYAPKTSVLIIGTDDGKLILWEVLTGRISTSSPSHLQPVSHLAITKDNALVISGSGDSSLHIWSLSELISFDQSNKPYNTSVASNTPLRTFSNHRAEITALTIANSATNTNFAVSASADQTCYLWHLGTCQILRTLLIPSSAIAIVLDPADRAVYLGCQNGTIQHADLYGDTNRTFKSSLFDTQDTHPIQLATEDQWSTGISEAGSATCITLSYDGTIVLSGHQNGAIIRWDVAKHRVISEITNLHQPVSVIQMLEPDNLRQEILPYTAPSIVKPRLDLSSEVCESTVALPASYSIQARVREKSATPSAIDDDTFAALMRPGFPTSMMTDAIQAMLAKTAGVSSLNKSTKRDVASEVQTDQLRQDMETLQAQLKIMRMEERRQYEKHLDRANRRTKIQEEKRQAYFDAKKDGKNGDIAMAPFEDQISKLDEQSDEEYLSQRLPIYD